MNKIEFDPKIEKQVAEIRHKLVLRMNGVTADTMEKAGVNYDRNFGLSHKYIYEIAQKYTPNMLLAERLYNMNIRETMLIGWLLTPIEELTTELALTRINNFKNSEIAIFSCKIIEKIVPLQLLIDEIFKSDNVFALITGIQLVTNLMKNNAVLGDQYLETISSFLINDNLDLHLAVARFYKALAHVSPNRRNMIAKKIAMYENSDSFSKRRLFQDVYTELEYGEFNY